MFEVSLYRVDHLEGNEIQEYGNLYFQRKEQ